MSAKIMSKLMAVVAVTMLMLVIGVAPAIPASAAPRESSGTPLGLYEGPHGGEGQPVSPEDPPISGEEGEAEVAPAGDEHIDDAGDETAVPAPESEDGQLILEEVEVASEVALDGEQLTLDDRFTLAAQQLPGFGGVFYDENGQLTMYMLESELSQQATESATSTAASGAVVAAALGLDERLAETEQLRVIKGQYSFLQLKQWHDHMTFDVLGLPGVVLTDIDESRNRLRIGVETIEQQSAVEQHLAQLGIPRQAVVIEVTPPVEIAAHTLRSRTRPLVGGIQIRSANSFCTLGFVAVRAGVQGFVTNSHCTNTRGGVEGTIFHQPDLSGTTNRIGLETRDPAFFTGGACPAGRRCRYSDTAFVRVPHPLGPSVAFSTVRGLIARPSAFGTLNVSHIAPRFRIVGETLAPLMGETLNKVGRTTGWSQGRVIGTCQATNVRDTNITLLCQDRVNARSGPGDSGSPVFRITNSPAVRDVRLYGILWGGVGNEFVFSAMSTVNIQRAAEMGPLTTCAPGFGC